MSVTTSGELLRRNHDAIDGLALDVRSAGSAAQRGARLREFSAAVAMHGGCLRAVVMPALATSRPAETRALLMENLAAVDRTLLAALVADVGSAVFSQRFADLEALLQVQFELEGRMLFPLLLARREDSRPALAQRIETYGASAAVASAREPDWFARGLR